MIKKTTRFPGMLRKKHKKQNKSLLAITSLLIAILTTTSILRHIKEKQTELSRAVVVQNTPPGADGIIIKYKEGREGRISEEIKKYLTKNPTHKFGRVYTIDIPEDQIEEALAEIQKSDDIEYAEPDFYYQYLLTPNDPLFKDQWWLKKIEAENAWDVTQGDEAVRVGIIDSGISNTHDDLSSKVLLWKYFSGNTPYDVINHGTMVGGIISAITNNKIGVSSIGYNIRIISLKVGDMVSKLSTVAEAIRWAADNNVDIVNISLGATEDSKTMREAIKYAWSKGVFIVAAAGNEGGSKPLYPAIYPNVFSVAATGRDDKKKDFSTYGNWVDIAAPGEEILSTSQSGGYTSADGTSLSSPIVAGVAALIKSRFPSYTNAKIEQVLCDTADRIQGTGSYWRCGRVNAFKAVNSAPPISPTATPRTSPTPTPNPSNVLKLNLRFQGITQKANNQDILVEFYKESSLSYKEEKSNENDENGIYSFVIDNTSQKVNPGKYDIRIKGESHLGKKFKSVEIRSTNDTVNLTYEDIKAGDVNNDNKITIADIAQILSYYKAFSVTVNRSDPKMVHSDINKDGKITIIDVAITALNWSSFNVTGE